MDPSSAVECSETECTFIDSEGKSTLIKKKSEASSSISNMAMFKTLNKLCLSHPANQKNKSHNDR